MRALPEMDRIVSQNTKSSKRSDISASGKKHSRGSRDTEGTSENAQPPPKKKKGRGTFSYQPGLCYD